MKGTKRKNYSEKFKIHCDEIMHAIIEIAKTPSSALSFSSMSEEKHSLHTKAQMQS
jgi:hypothetical protein